ncbi:MAG TPA: glycosyltransferase [Candidatus Bathyarchaeia archaeon]|nr:glycosyltransferase [Candidatus Bathyarchaeia archaeon]
MESTNLRISIIVTCLNAAETIGECIRSLTSQNYPNIEVILVDAGSTDGTTSQALKASGNRGNFKLIVDKSASTPARGRNVGANAARGDFLAFTDSDCIAEPNWISALVNPENWKENVGAVGGKTVFTDIPNERGMLSALHGALGTRLGSAGSIEFFEGDRPVNAKSLPSCNAMYSSKVFRQSGGFDETLRYCEDSCLNARIRRGGLRLTYTPTAVVHHRHRNSIGQFVRWMFDYGTGRGVAMKRDRGAITFPTLLIVPVSLAILALAIWRVLPLDVLLMSMLALYLAIDIAASLAKTRKPQEETLFYAASYPLIHFSYLAGLTRGLVRRRRGDLTYPSSVPHI